MTDSEKRLAERRLAELVRSVRLRWKLRLVLRGLVWTLGVSALVFLLSAVLVERLRFSPEAVIWLRVASWGTLLGMLGVLVLRPLLRPVTDTQVALYLEEHEPSIDLAVVSALEAGRDPRFSPALTARVLEQALQRAKEVEYGRRIEQTALYRFGGALSGLAVAGLLFLLLGPTQL